MSKDTLIDEARALKEKFENAALRFLETYKPDYPYDQITAMADFARQVAADAVRERDEMLGEATRIHFGPNVSIWKLPTGRYSAVLTRNGAGEGKHDCKSLSEAIAYIKSAAEISQEVGNGE